MLLWINGRRAPWLDPLAAWLSEWGVYVLPVALLAIALGRRRAAEVAAARDAWFAVLSAMFLAEFMLKPLAHRARPTAEAAILARLHVLGATPSARSLSFPSGTAAMCAAAAALVWCARGPRAGAAAAAFAALVSLSRLYAGVHWPSDVVAGAALGAMVGVGAWRLSRWLERADRAAAQGLRDP